MIILLRVVIIFITEKNLKLPMIIFTFRLHEEISENNEI